jgi:2-keto-4-pentenoate hydratase/2-oxohepta-3-ene-1,7-dioic acid hydratase in catechol pathway
MTAQHFGIATLRSGDGKRFPALSLHDGFWPLYTDDQPRRYPDLKALLAAWPAAWPWLQGLAATCRSHPEFSARLIAPQQARVEVPIQYPNKLIAVGANYRDHLREVGRPAEKWPTLPFFFKPPSTTMVGPGRTVRKPKTTRQLDWEIELAVVIGARLSDVDLDTARAGIAGFTIGIDLSCRDLARAGGALGLDLARGKAQDTMAPTGPVIVPAAFIPDPHRLNLRLYVNGEIKQNGSTADMLFRVEEIVSLVSRFVTLEPGDVVFTGTPAGTGIASGSYLEVGDRIKAEIQGIGALEVEIADATT